MTPDDRAVTLLRQELTTATAGLVPRPDVAARAAAGGRRRLRRRRITEAALTAGAALAVTVAVVAPLSLHADPSQPAKRPDQAPSQRSDSPPPGDPMLWLYHRPPQGDLAGKSTYVQSVISAWNRNRATSRNAKSGIFENLRGEPRVVWAGETPAGPAALVVQPAAFPDRAAVTGAGPGDGTVVGFVGVDEERRPRVVDDSFSYDGVSPALQPLTAWFVDPGRNVVAALELGRPLAWAQGWRYHDDGTRDRDWKQMTFRDGVSTARVDGSRHWDVEVAPTPYDLAADNVAIAGGEQPPPVGQSLRWGPDPLSGDPARVQIKGLTLDAGTARPYELFARALETRLRGRPYSSDGLPVWTASGTLPDGTEVVVSDTHLDADPSHAYAVLERDGETRVIHGGEVDRFAVLPIVIRLPDGMGTVVARSQARLEWSSATTTWQEMGFGAALVPPDATRVRVTLPGEEVHIVDLPRLGDTP